MAVAVIRVFPSSSRRVSVLSLCYQAALSASRRSVRLGLARGSSCFAGGCAEPLAPPWPEVPPCGKPPWPPRASGTEAAVITAVISAREAAAAAAGAPPVPPEENITQGWSAVSFIPMPPLPPPAITVPPLTVTVPSASRRLVVGAVCAPQI